MNRSQLRPLVALRWRMVRSRRARWGFAALASALPALCLLAIAVGAVAPRERSFDISLVAPTAYLSVALLAVLAPLVAGGGNELFPPDQLVAYPVSERTQYAASLALTPLNLAWVSQLVALVGLTAYVAGPTRWMPLALATGLAYLAFVTVGGQALAWSVIGVRQRSGGRTLTWVLAAVLALGCLGLIATGRVAELLDHAPTTALVTAATLVHSRAGLVGWAFVTCLLVAMTVLSHAAGVRACGWALRRSGDGTSRLDARTVRRRGPAASARAELLATDRASVWRSPSLRRGLLVLGLLPGAVAATADLQWSSLVLLPGLVAAGAGLLFGVNAFCLDGAGAVWLASLPHRPGLAFWCKTQVVGETCVVAIATTLTAGTIRTGRAPTPAEAAAMASCAVVVLVRVVATCMELSVTRPHRADLAGPRDTPAPPGVMAAYSARLAVSTTLVAVLFSALAEVAPWEWPVLFAVPFVLLAVRRLVRASGRWQDPLLRSRVVTTVASG